MRRGVRAVVGVGAGPVGRQTERYVHLYCALGESMSNSGRSPRYKQRHLNGEDEKSGWGVPNRERAVVRGEDLERGERRTEPEPP